MVFCLFLLFGPFSAFFPQFLFKGFQELKLPDWEWGPPPDPNGEVSVTFHEGHPLMQCDSQFSIWIRGRPQFPVSRPGGFQELEKKMMEMLKRPKILCGPGLIPAATATLGNTQEIIFLQGPPLVLDREDHRRTPPVTSWNFMNIIHVGGQFHFLPGMGTHCSVGR